MKKKTLWGIAIIRAIREIQQENGDLSPIPKDRISKRIGVGVDYIESIMTPLVNARILYARRGRKGGYNIRQNAVWANQISDLYEKPSVNLRAKDLPEFCAELAENLDVLESAFLENTKVI